MDLRSGCRDVSLHFTRQYGSRVESAGYCVASLCCLSFLMFVGVLFLLSLFISDLCLALIYHVLCYLLSVILFVILSVILTFILPLLLSHFLPFLLTAVFSRGLATL